MSDIQHIPASLSLLDLLNISSEYTSDKEVEIYCEPKHYGLLKSYPAIYDFNESYWDCLELQFKLSPTVRDFSLHRPVTAAGLIDYIVENCMKDHGILFGAELPGTHTSGFPIDLAYRNEMIDVVVYLSPTTKRSSLLKMAKLLNQYVYSSKGSEQVFDMEFIYTGGFESNINIPLKVLVSPPRLIVYLESLRQAKLDIAEFELFSKNLLDDLPPVTLPNKYTEEKV